ncbi:MAG: hypothetical protein CVU63_01260 [Deltaproteobacteria bacterium HGW-Deltaproteobacteria-20]|nr:MAG: hypothetical protein CVU63_01260 [Deltaproteobacteria bacterium HGW-Deltaproteobacteria-20]
MLHSPGAPPEPPPPVPPVSPPVPPVAPPVPPPPVPASPATPPVPASPATPPVPPGPPPEPPGFDELGSSLPQAPTRRTNAAPTDAASHVNCCLRCIKTSKHPHGGCRTTAARARAIMRPCTGSPGPAGTSPRRKGPGMSMQRSAFERTLPSEREHPTTLLRTPIRTQ